MRINKQFHQYYTSYFFKDISLKLWELAKINDGIEDYV